MKLKVAQASAALVIRHGASRLAMWAGGECQHFDRPTVSSRYACTRILLCVPLQLVCMPCLVWWRQRHAHTQHLCSGCKWRASVRLDLGAECLCGLDVSHRLQPDCMDPVGSLLRRLPRSSISHPPLGWYYSTSGPACPSAAGPGPGSLGGPDASSSAYTDGTPRCAGGPSSLGWGLTAVGDATRVRMIMDAASFGGQSCGRCSSVHE